MAIFENAVTAAQGFSAAGVHVGVKTSNKSKKDVALIYSDAPCKAAGVFTTNNVKAAPVLYDIKTIANGKAQAVIANSGNANACTGQQGLDDAQTMANLTASALGIHADDVLVCSTGVIGHNLPMDRIEQGIKEVAANLSESGGRDAAEAILTTDVWRKEMANTVDIDGITVTVGGMAKGSGMICPHMATMLCFITTDANIDGETLKKAIREAATLSFNQISVDGDMSTNDTCIILANGKAGNAEIQYGTEAYDKFMSVLKPICNYLAKKIARDGEGATHLFEAEVINAASEEDALKAAKSVVSSDLVKAAVFGKDANWGRIICAVGYSGAEFDQYAVDIKLASDVGEITVAVNGGGLEFDEDLAAKILAEENVKTIIDLKAGEHSGKAWGCDLTYDYVKINADYRT
ncbi:MAG: bifunctional glutamate N-acetyltransferase/amino-acid acetyltransferase ArgJ [Firmicutes bacterium]|nr:bifunctional glutamate N-acetyltransferase/amino-acid acetyltransferase ArgJ [Bacillota bacterium]